MIESMKRAIARARDDLDAVERQIHETERLMLENTEKQQGG